MDAMSTAHTLRPARPEDLPAIVGLITELAEFEHLAHLVQVTSQTLHPQLFGDKPVVECWVAEASEASKSSLLTFRGTWYSRRWSSSFGW